MGQINRAARWRTRLALAAVLVVGPLLVTAPEATAHDRGHGHGHGDDRVAFTTVPLISDVAGRAPLVDPQAVNAWGLALGPTTPLWANYQVGGVSNLYAGGVGGGPVTKVLSVPVPNGNPTGIVFNDTSDFLVTGSGGTQPARFIFVNLAGEVSGWNPQATPGPAVIRNSTEGAVYTGLTLWRTPLGNFLLAADFRNGRIDVFDSQFRKLAMPPGFFTDSRIPAGFTTYNVLAVGTDVYVTYAMPGPDGRPTRGRGLGFVNKFSDFGQDLRRLEQRGDLNAPWGLAIAPASFGRFAGDLLVGNFGDGRITALDPRSGRNEGMLRGTDGHALEIDGLWGLLPGTATTGGVDGLWFAAGPDDETHGLVGLIRPAG